MSEKRGPAIRRLSPPARREEEEQEGMVETRSGRERTMKSTTKKTTTSTARRTRRPAAEGPMKGAPRLGLNLALTGVIFLSPAMVLMLDDHGLLTKTRDAFVASASKWSERQNPTGTQRLPYLEEKVFLRHVNSRLPRYKAVFQKEAQRRGIPWKLLASQAYQESRWNPRAVSPTGVRGIMMLTRNTSSSYGIQNRLDPQASIHGGARHLSRLLRQLPPEVTEPDRTWIALAAYNVGMGHVKDARMLASRLGKDPNRWSGLREVLPLLAQKEYYKTLPHRYARGWEPVQYVRRIRGYWALLKQNYQGPEAPVTPQL